MYSEKSTRILRRESVFESSRFRVERRTFLLENGQEHTREVIQHPGAVVILPILDDGRVCLIRNYRVAIDSELLELPAGTLEPPEPPREAAERELVEETGFRCRELLELGTFFMSPGILNERMFAFVARGLSAGEQALEEGEEIQTVLLSMNEIMDRIARGEIQDSKTLSTLLLFKNRRT